MNATGTEKLRQDSLSDEGDTHPPQPPPLLVLSSPAQKNTNESSGITTVADDIPNHKRTLAENRGKEYLGLPQHTLPTVDKLISGFRGLMLLAAHANVGKTALGVQIGLDIVVNDQEACFLFVSMEMSRGDIMNRMLCRLSGVDYDRLVRGPINSHDSEDEIISQAEAQLEDLGKRILILDDPEPSVDSVLSKLQALKMQTGASKAFILLDYLQIWSISDEANRYIHSDIGVDKCRIDAMKRLQADGNAVLAISELRKSAAGEPSAQSSSAALADVMGSARAGYAADMVFILRPKESTTVPLSSSKWRSHPDKKRDQPDEKPKDIPPSSLVQQLEFQIVKGRDGVKKDSITLNFYYQRHQFEEADMPK